MRIAVFIKGTTFHGGFGGLETQNKNLCEGLAKRGIGVVVFSPKKDVDYDKLQKNGVAYIFVPCVFRSLFSSVVKKHWYNQSFKFFVKENEAGKFDLIISQSSAGVGLVRNKNVLGVPVLTISHGSIISEMKTRLSNVSSVKSLLKLMADIPYVLYSFFGKQRDFILQSDKVVAVSEYVKKAVIEETYVPEDKIVVIHNGIDPTPFSGASYMQHRDAIAPAVKQFLFVGRIEKEKGVDTLVDIARDSRFADTTIHIVGEGLYRSNLEENISKFGLADKFVIYGKVSPEEVISCYKTLESPVFLFPTRRHEGFPMVLVEAMFAGLPIISFDMGGVSDAVVDNATGYVVKAGDAETFKQRTLDVIGNPLLYQRMSENAVRKARNEFTLERMIDSYVQIIEEITK